MVKLNIAVDSDALRQLQSALAQFGAGNFPVTTAAMQSAASVVRSAWQGFAMGGSLPGIESLKRPSGKYARSIKIDRKGPFDYEVYSEAKVADWIENGTEALDMKTTHPFGPRSRMGKSGYPYLIVPFRWGTPRTVGFRNVIPEEIYKIVKNKEMFAQTKTTVSADESSIKTPNAKDEMVGRAQYSDTTESTSWGSRLTADMSIIHRLSEDIPDNMIGMSSMVGQNGKSSGYLTFRVISAAPGATGWIKPAMPARPVTQKVVEVTQGVINDVIDSAIKGDLGL